MRRTRRHPSRCEKMLQSEVANISGLLIDRDTDWDEIETLLTGSYCVPAPKKPAILVEGVQG